MNSRDERLMRLLDGELTEQEAQEIEAALAADEDAARGVSQARAVGSLLRSTLKAEAAEVDFSRVWAGVEKEITWRQAGAERAGAARAEAAGVKDSDVSWRDSLRWLLGWRMLTGVAAAAIALIVLPPMLNSTSPTVVLPAAPVGTVQMVATTHFDGVVVDSVETADDTTVMVFQGGDEQATFIWISEGAAGESI